MNSPSPEETGGFSSSVEQRAYNLAYREGYLFGRLIRAEYDMETLLSHTDDLEAQVQIDDLTGLLRRNAFIEEIHGRYQKSQRVIDLERTHSVLFLDLDDFGAINKDLGTTVGDNCLRLTGKAITDSLFRENDKACRWGGEEFVVLLADTSIKYAEKVAERIQKQVNTIKPDTSASATRDRLGITIGIVRYQHGTDFLRSFNEADRVASHAKKTVPGKNQIVIVED